MLTFIVLLASYLAGSISFSYLIAKYYKGIDIREHGSKNAGATNTLRVIGKGPAIIVLLLDALKGIVAVAMATILIGQPLIIMLAGLLSIIGHNWPIFFKFKGGKGVATTIGVMATVAFIPALISGILTLVLIIAFRYVSLGSLMFSTSLPILMYLIDFPYEYIVGAIIIAILSYVRHRDNIKRLWLGKENKLGKRREK